MTDDEQTKGNDDDKWQKLLRALDEKLQLGLLEHMRRVSAYEFAGNTLKITPISDDIDYLKKSSVIQQLALLAQDAIGIKDIEIIEE